MPAAKDRVVKAPVAKAPPTPRTKFLDYDARHTPKTDFCCVMCQRDLDPRNRKIRWVDLVDYVHVLHPADAALYTSDGHARGMYPLGPECVKKIGIEWTHSSRDFTRRD